MSHNYTEIDPAEIRRGDTIRCEYASTARTGFDAVEYVATKDGTGKSTVVATYYLIDRPTPPIELPTKPTLGWARVENGVRAVGIWSTYTHRYNLSDQETVYLINPEREFAVSDVVEFIPGTLVPTSALDALRKAERITQTTKGDDTKRNYQRKDAILAFLADVDSANE